MTEWGVVLVIIALAGLITTVIKPVITLTKSITKLTVVVEGLQMEFSQLTSKNTTAHARLWAHNEGQDRQLEEHERRISQVEGRIVR